jgi:hypothetical protein
MSLLGSGCGQRSGAVDRCGSECPVNGGGRLHGRTQPVSAHPDTDDGVKASASARLPGTVVDMSSAPASHDLRSFLIAVGGLAGGGALKAAPTERPVVDFDVDVLDADASKVVASPMAVTGFVDGVQSAAAVTWREHRPVYLTYVAAAAVGARGIPAGVIEHLEVLCATADGDWAREVAGTIPVREIDVERPGELESAAFTTLGARRERCERDLVDQLIADPGCGALILDGSLVGRPRDTRLAGVVKTTRRQYLPDESVLWRLPEGWRSPRFRIPAGAGAGVDRFSCYLRLFDARAHGWDFGLLRLETFDADVLDELAARCLIERQGAGARDARWDRHLGGVRQVENYLRSRRPSVFN